ncbi:DUF317 domain-containing protein [Streptomyces anulatus]|uniref:DUF317 domain-containing protein n=1 Tax=Streptomyces anulatus TaxID=1892 RepID=UPI00386DDBE7
MRTSPPACPMRCLSTSSSPTTRARSPQPALTGPRQFSLRPVPRAGFEISTRPRTTVLAPRLVAGISLEDVPVLVQGSDPRSGLLGWQSWAEPVLGDPYLWCASFSASVPYGPVAMFASSLASPHPVRRNTLPTQSGRWLTVQRPEGDRRRRARGVD